MKGKGLRQQIEEAGNTSYNFVKPEEIKQALEDIKTQDQVALSETPEVMQERYRKLQEKFPSHEDFRDWMTKEFFNYKERY